MTYTYLASPYSHPDCLVRFERYREARTCTAWLLKQHVWVYSPIVHCHDLATFHDLPIDASYWRYYNFAMLQPADRLLILTLEGWSDSKGISDEVNFAHTTHKPIEFISPKVYTVTEEPVTS